MTIYRQAKNSYPGQALFLITLLVLTGLARAQQIEVLDSSWRTVSYRGLSVPSAEVVWVSGSKGTVGRSTDGGKHWEWVNPVGYEGRDFRDVHAFDGQTALIMAVDRPAVILKTTDGGKHWKKVYERDIEGIFLDAMNFKDSLRGLAIGDPINEHFWIVETRDGGNSWSEIPLPQTPLAYEGEALFASSGSNIQFVDYPGVEYAFVSGGTISRLHLMSGIPGGTNGFVDLGMPRGRSTKGANSLAVRGKTWLIAGGDYNLPLLGEYNMSYSLNRAKSWSTPGIEPPFGYKSCVILIPDGRAIATGTAGLDISGKNLNFWKHFSDMPFHVIHQDPLGKAIFLAGPSGRIARLNLR